jgi:outer membrane protein assembly factor BamD
MSRDLCFGVLFVVAVGCTACSTARRDDDVLKELANLDKQTIFDTADALLEEGKIEKARKHFSFIYDTFPNDPLGHKAALRVADTYSLKKDTASQTEARLRYRDFANRYPNDPDRDYALLMVGRSYSSQRKGPDRDLTLVRESLSAYQQLMSLYPNSKYLPEAQEEVTALREILAEHELLVARFYARNRRWQGVVWRLEFLKENYPDYRNMSEVEQLLEQAQKTIAEHEAAIKEFLESKKEAEDR